MNVWGTQQGLPGHAGAWVHPSSPLPHGPPVLRAVASESQNQPRTLRVCLPRCVWQSRAGTDLAEALGSPRVALGAGGLACSLGGLIGASKALWNGQVTMELPWPRLWGRCRATPRGKRAAVGWAASSGPSGGRGSEVVGARVRGHLQVTSAIPRTETCFVATKRNLHQETGEGPAAPSCLLRAHVPPLLSSQRVASM